MSSVGTVVAQRPRGGQNFNVNLLTDGTTAAYVFPTTSVQAAAPTGSTQVVGSVISYSTVAAACSTASGALLNGAVVMGSLTPTAITLGTQMRDMGRTVTVLVNGVQAFKLQLVQLRNQNSNTTEGVGGSSTGLYNAEGYFTFYVVVESNLTTAAPNASGVGIVGVSRV